MVRINFCAGFGILLAIASVVLVIFGNIGQLNNSTVPRRIRLVSLSTSGLGQNLAPALNIPADAIYNTENGYVSGRSVNGTGTGLRRTYEWGVWDYCATDGAIGSERSYCTKRSFGFEFKPATALLTDIPNQYEQGLAQVLPSNVFVDEKYLGRFTKAASYLIFIGSILAALAMLVGFGAHRFAFLFGAFISLLAFLCLAVGCVIYTIIYSRVKAAINDASFNGANLGIEVNYGIGLWLLWGATGAIFLSIIPYFVACCTGRRDHQNETY